LLLAAARHTGATRNSVCIPAATPGDLYLELHVALPPATTEAQRAAYRALAQAFPHFQPRTQGA